MNENLNIKNLDNEWMNLIFHALESGIPASEIIEILSKINTSKN
ncbi:hypothetical protein [Bacillus sp. SA1-12]|nr:hypothetical protein [Bacillus sp. SA1-12]